MSNKQLFQIAQFVLVALVGIGGPICFGQETTVWIATKQGELIQGITIQQFVPWNNVTEKGEITKSRLAIDSQGGDAIQRLILTEQPASAAIAKVRKLVTQLSSHSYVERHNAETELIKMGGPYQDIIRSIELPEVPETQIRLERIKRTLSMRTSVNVKTEFDFAWTNSGKKLSGDVGDWKVAVDVRGRKIEFDRSNIEAIYFSDLKKSFFPLGKLEHHSFYYQLEDGFQNEKQQMVSFETDNNGFKIPNDTDTNVSYSFKHLGCIFECEGHPSNHVIVSNFSMKGSVSQNNSVCNIRPEEPTKQKFYGVMRIRFVDPKFPNVPAVVNQFGLFMAVVSPRQSVIEAYNIDGYQIGKIESTRLNSFTGLHSQEPIAYVRVLANKEYVLPDDVSADENFAIDDVFISVPIATDQAGSNNRCNIVMKNGQRWMCKNVKFNGETVVLYDSDTFGTELELDRAEIRSIVFPGALDKSSSGLGTVLGMLKDGTVVKVIPGEKFRLANFDQAEVEPPGLIGYWGAEQIVRYPESADFVAGKVVVVLPNVRAIAPEFSLEQGRCNIEFDSVTAVVPPAELEKVRVPNDIEPVKDLEYSNSPCVWFAQPAPIDHQPGIVRLKDGRRFVLNGDFEITITDLNTETLTLSRAGKTLDIPIELVRSIRFPK